MGCHPLEAGHNSYKLVRSTGSIFYVGSLVQVSKRGDNLERVATLVHQASLLENVEYAKVKPKLKLKLTWASKIKSWTTKIQIKHVFQLVELLYTRSFPPDVLRLIST